MAKRPPRIVIKVPTYAEILARAKKGRGQGWTDFEIKEALVRTMEKLGIQEKKQAQLIRLSDQRVDLVKYIDMLVAGRIPTREHSLAILNQLEELIAIRGIEGVIRRAKKNLRAVGDEIKHSRTVFSIDRPIKDASVGPGLIELAVLLINFREKMILGRDFNSFRTLLNQELGIKGKK